MISKRRTYLIQNPYDEDALQYIGAMDRYFGLRPVCLYTDPKDRFYGQLRFPQLTDDLVEENVEVDLSDLRPTANYLRDRYEIVAVIPYREDTVLPAANLAQLLNLDWIDPDVLRLFRDKGALRDHVRRVAPHVRVPDHRLVSSPAELVDGPLPERYVLKPNDGLGNVAIGIFEANQTSEAVAHMEHRPGTTWIVDEYIGGPEYHVNGQVRTGGDVTTLAVMEYLRTETNGYQTVYVGDIQLHHDDPVFQKAAEYATRLLTATGLERSPFHMEIKVDERGPCVIDIGARVGSDGTAKVVSRLHPDRPDVYAVAAHDFVGPNEFATDPVDWTYHDKFRTVYAYGISDCNGRIETLQGIDEVERRRDFVRWSVKPAIGDRLCRTKDLRGAPYIVELSIEGDRPDAQRVIDEVRATVTWNRRRDPRAIVAARASSMSRQTSRKVRWLAHRSFGLF